MTKFIEVRDYNGANGGGGCPELRGSDEDRPINVYVNLELVAFHNKFSVFGQDFVHVQMAGNSVLIVREEEWLDLLRMATGQDLL